MATPTGVSAQVPGECGGWTAHIDADHPGGSVLEVAGTCVFPTAGFSVELRRAQPQGINPRILLLERVVHAPSGPAATVLTEVPAGYSERAEPGRFDAVSIQPDGPQIPVADLR